MFVFVIPIVIVTAGNVATTAAADDDAKSNEDIQGGEIIDCAAVKV